MTHVCIGGGNIKGFCFLGALEYLFKSKKIKKINKFHGCSIGSFIGTLVIIGKMPNEIFKELLDIDFKKYWDLDINKIMTRFSILGNSIFDFWREYLGKLIDINITMKDFNLKFAVDMNIVSTCLTTRSIVIFNEEKYPNVKLIDALIASSSIPFIFEPYLIDGKHYVDGAVKCLSGCIPSSINSDTFVIKLDEHIKNTTNINILEYTLIVLKTMATEEEPVENTYTLSISVPDKYRDNINFSSMTESDKTELYLLGLKQAELFYKNKK